MIIFKVVSRILGVGPKKGKRAYYAQQKGMNRFSAAWMLERMVAETSLSEGDVMNVLITLRNLIAEVVKMGGSLDLGEVLSLRTHIPSKMMENEDDVTADALKRPCILVRWKSPITDALKSIEVEVDNPKRGTKAKTEP